MLPASHRSFRIPIRHVRCCSKAGVILNVRPHSKLPSPLCKFATDLHNIYVFPRGHILFHFPVVVVMACSLPDTTMFWTLSIFFFLASHPKLFPTIFLFHQFLSPGHFITYANCSQFSSQISRSEWIDIEWLIEWIEWLSVRSSLKKPACLETSWLSVRAGEIPKKI